MNNSSKILFLLILILGTMIVVSSNSWLSSWMGLEINLLSFIPLMSDKNLMSTEASLKYFLTQALASTVFLFFSILSLLENFYMKYINVDMVNMIILMSLLMKTGAAPFHFWFPMVMNGLSWMNSLILMTWQKIAPLMLISYILMKPLIIISVILSALVGSLGGLNQTSLNKLMAFSSINHLGWMLMSMYFSESIWWIYFLFYSFLSMNLIYFFNLFNCFYINQLFSLFFNSKMVKFSIFLNLLSLGGLPPFLGFIPKWIVIQNLTLNNQLMMMVILIVMTLITLFFYLRISYSAFMLNYYEPTWMINLNLNNFKINIYLLISYISIFGLFVISLIYNFN